MHTYRYKGWFVHENFNRGTFQVQNPHTHEIIPAKSLHSAKCLISRNKRILSNRV